MLLQDSEEDGEEDDEHPFETSMEHNYTEYNTNNIVEMSETSNKRFTNFEEEKSKRHCTEIEDEYDAIGEKLILACFEVKLL